MTMASKLIYIPSTSAALEATLIEARPGDLIQLLPINYAGEFELNTPPRPQFQPIQVNANNGQVQEQIPITIRGAKSHDLKKQTTIIPEGFQDEDEEPLGVGITIMGGRWIISDLMIKSNNRHTFDGVHIISDGHLLRNLSFSKNQRGVVIFDANNNRMENLTFNICNKAMFVSGQGNSIRNCSFNRITTYGIELSGRTNTGTVIENTVVRMQRNIPPRNNVGEAGGQEVDPPKIGSSFSNFHSDVRVKNCVFHGITYIYGNDSRFEKCNFFNVNLVGKRNEFISSKMKKVYQPRALADDQLENAVKAGCVIGE